LNVDNIRQYRERK